MATKKHSSIRNSSGSAADIKGAQRRNKVDGRVLAVDLLKEIEHLNTDSEQDLRGSRDLMAATLERLCDLPAKERIRFATILNDTIGNMYAGVIFYPETYDYPRSEIARMGLATRILREVAAHG